MSKVVLFKDKDFEITQTKRGNKILWIDEKDRTVNIAFMKHSTQIMITDTNNERELEISHSKKQKIKIIKFKGE